MLDVTMMTLKDVVMLDVAVMFDVTTITDVTLMPLLFLLQNAIVKEVCNPEALLTMMKVSKDFNQSFQYSTVGAYQCCCIRFLISCEVGSAPDF